MGILIDGRRGKVLDLHLKSFSTGNPMGTGSSPAPSVRMESSGVTGIESLIKASKASSKGVGEEGTSWVEGEGSIGLDGRLGSVDSVASDISKSLSSQHSERDNCIRALLPVED